VPLVLFGIFRFLYLLYQRSGERNSTETILRDLPFLAPTWRSGARSSSRSSTAA